MENLQENSGNEDNQTVTYTSINNGYSTASSSLYSTGKYIWTLTSKTEKKNAHPLRTARIFTEILISKPYFSATCFLAHEPKPNRVFAKIIYQSI